MLSCFWGFVLFSCVVAVTKNADYFNIRACVATVCRHCQIAALMNYCLRDNLMLFGTFLLS